ncbi:MAG TPA: peptidoglycan endopeptidase [Candidatus Melainabacteria bacterium]|nr:peptidoglycan endopeptidase [Candidatus Melainabacteria bacterium]HIN67094.1 peptidoglycan endopeptidase [Candidatus Obscuribacterales bacterium]
MNQAQWGDVLLGPNGRPMNGRDIDPGIYADMGNFAGDPGIYARSNFNGDNGMVIYPSRERLGVDEMTYRRMRNDAYDFNRGYDPRDNPNYASNWGGYDDIVRANHNYGPNVRLQLGPLQLNLGNGGRYGWTNYDNFNRGGWDRGGYDRYNNYGTPTYRDNYGRPYQPDNYGWGSGSQWGRDRYYDQRDQYGWGNGRYDGYNSQWNDNYRAQQMQRMALALFMQMMQRQRQGQWGHYDRYDRGNWGRDPYGRDQYGRDQYGWDQYRDPRDMYRDQRYRYDDRSWQQGRDQYGRPYDLDQYGWGNQNGRDRYGRYDQYGQYGQYDRYGRQDQYDRYGRYDQYDRYGRGGGDQYWNSLAGTIQTMLGRSIREFDPRVPETRGCASFVSAALRNSFNINIRDTNCQGLENSLRRNGFQQVDIRDLRPGDIIIGNRSGSQPGHAAIYAGDGMVAQNSSGKRRITVESANVFNGKSFQRVVAYRPNA